MLNYSNCAIVVFGSIGQEVGNELSVALDACGIQFAEFPCNDIVYISAKGVTLDVPTHSWDLALVWDHGRGCRLTDIGGSLLPRLRAVIQENGLAVIVQHGNSTHNFAPQKRAFNDNGGNSLPGLCWDTYTRQAGNPLYDALVAVLKSASGHDPNAYVQSLRKLMALLVPVYERVVGILSAFLPADLAWQTKNGDDATKLLPKREDIQAQFETITRFTNACLPPASVPQEAIDAVAQYLDGSSSCSLFTQLPNHTDKFHANYVALRDRLFEIVEAIERTQGQKA